MNRRTLLALAVVGALAFLGGRASAQATLKTDMAWWGSLPSDSRSNVVAGIVSAYQTGWLAGAAAEDLRLVNGTRSAAARELIIDLAFEKNSNGAYLSGVGLPVFTHTYGFYVAGITDFYLRFPQKTKVEVARVVACLADNPDRLHTCSTLQP